MRNSLAEYNPEVRYPLTAAQPLTAVQQTGLTCLFLASKSQDAMKHVTQLAALAVFKQRSDTAKAQGKPPKDKEPMHIKDEPEVVRLQESMLSSEITLLRTLTFDLALRQPFPLLMDAARALHLFKFDVVMMHAVLNDSMRSTIALSYPPVVIAMVAFILPSAVADEAYLSDKYRAIRWQDALGWMHAFGFNVQERRDALTQQQQGGKRSRGETDTPSSKRMKGANGAVSSVDERLQTTDPDAALQSELEGAKEASNALDVHISEEGEITSKEVESVNAGEEVRDEEIDNVLMNVRDAIVRFVMVFRYFDRDVRARQQANKERIRALLSCFPKRPGSVWREGDILDSF